MREIVKRETIGASIACASLSSRVIVCVSGAASQWRSAISHIPGGKVTHLCVLQSLDGCVTTDCWI